MSSGSYFPPAVKRVEIEKKSGGKRVLGVPTVSDRIAQMVVKLMVEPQLEGLFHPDSYGYRPGKSAKQAIAVTRERCWRYDWAVEFDIKGAFDNLDHDLLMKAVRTHINDRWVLLYIERWLKAPFEAECGDVVFAMSVTYGLRINEEYYRTLISRYYQQRPLIFQLYAQFGLVAFIAAIIIVFVAWSDPMQATSAGIDIKTTPLPKLVLIGLSATSIEWYDFFLYGTAAALVFPTVFFSGTLTPAIALIASFGTFAAGFIARPIGAVVFGRFGDRKGRKLALATALYLMGCATTLIGCLPSYASAGALAPVLLVTLRFLQGLAIGGQWGGAMLLITESCPATRRGFYGSFAQMGVPVGLIFANLAFLLASRSMDSAVFLNWGWRIPFLLSVVLFGLAVFVQRHAEDSQVFRRQQAEGASNSTILDALRQYPSQIALAAGAVIAVNATFYVLITFVVAYGSGAGGLNIPRATMLAAVLISAAVMTVVLVVAGAWSDRFGRLGVYRLGCVIVGAWAFALFPLIETRSLLWIAVALSVGNVGCALMYAPQAALFAELFATKVRYLCASLGVQLGAIFGGGLAPIIAAGLMVKYHNSLAISIYVAAICVVSFISVTLLGETRHLDLNRTIESRP